MNTISEFLTTDHRTCDKEFANMENAVASGNWDDAKKEFDKFSGDLYHHFDMEEKVMFPTFEERAQMSGCGPTEMMRMEHTQMRNLVEEMREDIQSKNKDHFFGLSETLMMLMQQHNMKEEQMLYQMADNTLGSDAANVVSQMQGLERA